MKKIKVFLLSIIIFAFAILFLQIQAAEPDAFVVDVQPSSFDPNSPVDMTVKAVKGDGTVITDYEGDVYIDVAGSIDPSDYIVPSDHLYTFVPQDQGVKLFSKGLIIKKAGTYTIQVSDIINDSIKGEKTVIVGATSNLNLKQVIIDNPMQSGTEKNEVINVFGNVQELPNSPFEVRLNNQSASQGITDAIGGFNAYITGTIDGTNVLQVKILDINNTIIGESNLVNFNYSPIADGVFNSIQILPGAKISQGAKATFVVDTNDSVTSVQLNLSNGKTSPMDKTIAGTFTKDLMMDTAGNIQVDVDLILAGVKKSYTGVANLVVEKGTSIGKVRIFGDPIIKSKLNITREVIGEASQYKILYGTGETNLIRAVLVPTKEITLENLLTGQVYYFQIIPLDANGAEAGLPSDIVQAKVGELTIEGGVSCIVNGIIISDITIGEKHYLTWSGILNVDRYVIYRSDFETSDINQMNKVAEITGTMFEYPFTANAKKERYSYYVVQAICTDGNGIIVDNVKKVTTGPVENILLFILITMFLYCSYRLYRYSEN